MQNLVILRRWAHTADDFSTLQLAAFPLTSDSGLLELHSLTLQLATLANLLILFVLLRQIREHRRDLKLASKSHVNPFECVHAFQVLHGEAGE